MTVLVDDAQLLPIYIGLALIVFTLGVLLLMSVRPR